MTRRIVAAILLTVWAIVIAGGVTAYFVTRSVLLAELDALLVERAMAVPEVQGRAARQAEQPHAGEDRYVVKAVGRIVASSARAGGQPPVPEVATFSRPADGRKLRTVTLTLPASGTVEGVPAGTPVTVVYSGSAGHLDRVLNRLALTLAVCGLLAGAAAAAVAVAVARAALRPLHEAAATVGDIDEARLDRRIDEPSLPTELRPVAARLNGMLARLEQAFALRKRFLADASHELRTPVAALVTAMEVSLRKRREAPELRRTIEACLGEARYLRRLVTTLLEHARGEAAASGAGAAATEVFDAAELLSVCADAAEGLAGERGVCISRSFAGPLTVRTQPDRLRGIVSNLLSNAVEYNRPGGEVALSARLEPGGLHLSVRDTGPGIDAEHVPHLFEPFYRAEAGRSGPRGGDAPHLGLGLFIVQSHLKALGGRCKVESEKGVGTTVHVTLPDVAAAGVAAPGLSVTDGVPTQVDAQPPEPLETVTGINGKPGPNTRAPAAVKQQWRG